MDVKTQSFTAGPAAVLNAVSSRPDKADPSAASGGGHFLWFLIRLLAIVLVFRIAVFAPFSIPSESMLPRLINGDYLIAAKWPYGLSRHSLPLALPLPEGRLLPGTPERGDVVIFKHPIDGRDYIKRVIGLPGDSVAVIGGQIVLNGRPVPQERVADFIVPLSLNTGCEWGGAVIRLTDGREACRYVRLRETLPGGRRYDVLDFGRTLGDDVAPVTVPAASLFVMGDNRDNSRDSRFPAMAGDAVGLVPIDRLVGRASVIVWSTDGSAGALAPWTWPGAVRWDRIGAGL